LENKMEINGLTVVLVAGLLISLATSAMCVETYDPNKDNMTLKKPVSDSILLSKAILSTKTTYSCKKTATRNVLSDLMKSTNITLLAGANAKDWEVRDRKINVFTKDTPLRDIMNSIARVTGFKWSIEGTKDKPIFRLIRNKQSREEQDAMRQADLLEQQREDEIKRKQTLDTLKSLDNPTLDELAKLRSENPFLFWMSASKMLKKFNNLLNNSPGLTQAILTGDSLTIKASSLSQAAQQSLIDLIEINKAMEYKMTGSNSGDPWNSSKIGDADIVINDPATLYSQKPGESRRHKAGHDGELLGCILVQMPSESIMVPLYDPNSPTTKLIGKILIEADLMNRPIQDVMTEFKDEFMKATQEEESAQSVDGIDSQTISTDISDPILNAKVKVKLDGKTLPDIQEQLAGGAEIAIVSDYFDGMQNSSNIDTQDKTLRKLLDSIARKYKYQWMNPGKPIEFQDKEWYDKVESLIPDELIDSWKQILIKTGTLDISELAQIANLTEEQFNINVMADSLLSTINLKQSLMQNKDLFKLLATLNKPQLTAAYSSSGFDLWTLKLDAYEMIIRAVSTHTSFILNQHVPLILKATRNTEGTNSMLEISITNEDENTTTPSITFPIILPKYTPPTKPGG